MNINYTLFVTLFIVATTLLRYAIEGEQGIYIGIAAAITIIPIAFIADLVSWFRRHRGRQQH